MFLLDLCFQKLVNTMLMVEMYFHLHTHNITTNTIKVRLQSESKYNNQSKFYI